MSEPAAPHMFVDGKNIAYRAIHANRSRRHRRSDIVSMLDLICGALCYVRPQSVHVFWDAPRNTVWRRDLFGGYKKRDDANPDRDISEELAAIQCQAVDLFAAMGVRQYRRDRMEADDLIYAACRVVCPQPAVVVSSDKDFLQIPFYMPNARQFDHYTSKWFDRPLVNPVTRKCLMGDISDKIGGYAGIGEKKSLPLAECHVKTYKFVRERGKERFVLNNMLIDLALCPYLLENQLEVAKIMARDAAFDRAAIMAAGGKYGILGLETEYDTTVMPFRNLRSPGLRPDESAGETDGDEGGAEPDSQVECLDGQGVRA